MTTDLRSATVGTLVWFHGEVRPYRVRARGERFIVLTKPMNVLHTVLYTVVDLENGIRGTEDLIFCAGAETRQQCRQMVRRLEEGRSEISRRNRMDLQVLRTRSPTSPASDVHIFQRKNHQDQSVDLVHWRNHAGHDDSLPALWELGSPRNVMQRGSEPPSRVRGCACPRGQAGGRLGDVGQDARPHDSQIQPRQRNGAEGYGLPGAPQPTRLTPAVRLSTGGRMNLIKKLLGGRPMKLDGFAFTDCVSGARINYYTDTLGRKWLAESRWSIFRVRD